MTSLGCCYWPGRRVFQCICDSCNVLGRKREGGVSNGKGMVNDVEGAWSLGGREMLSSMKNGICVRVEVVVVLMVAVGVMVLVEVLCIGAVVVDCS